MIRTYAPVAIFVYDRPAHFRSCIASLQRNNGAENTILFIASDGPRDEKSKAKVDEVRAFIKTIQGFKAVVPYLPEENTRGEIGKICRADIRKQFSRYILAEDDNIFSPFFLDFVNEGLERYADDPRVMAVCGYQNPGYPRTNRQEQIFLNAFSPWAFGIWREKDHFDEIVHEDLFSRVLHNFPLFSKISKFNPALPLMIYNQWKNGKEAADLVNNILMAERGLLCVFPTCSLIRNIGNDGSGVNAHASPHLQNQVLCEQPVHFIPQKPIRLEKETRDWHFRHKGGHMAVLANYCLFMQINSKCRATRKIYAFFFLLYQKIKGSAKKRLNFILRFAPTADLP